MNATLQKLKRAEEAKEEQAIQRMQLRGNLNPQAYMDITGIDSMSYIGHDVIFGADARSLKRAFMCAELKAECAELLVW